MTPPGAGEPDDAIPIVPPPLAPAHQAYFQRRDWPAALALWQAAAARAPLERDASLALAHCRIECAAPAELATLALGAVAPTPGAWLEQYGHLVRTRAFQWLNAGDPARAAHLTRLLALADPHIARIYQRSIIPHAAPTPIPTPIPPRDPAAAEAPLPFERALRLDDAAATALVERHRGRRVLIVIRHHRTPGNAVVEHEVCAQLRGVERFGVATLTLDSHPATLEGRLGFVDALRAAIAAFRPDIILYDDLLVSGPAADEAAQPVVLELLDGARRSHGTRLVVTYFDAWYDGMEALVETAAGLADLIHMPHPGLLARVPQDVAARIFCYPYPLRDLRGPAAAAPRPRAAFVGSINWANMSRLVWWAEIARLGLPVDLYPTLDPLARSREQYAELLGGYAIALNLTTRANERRILTNRTVEAPVYGSLLLEEETEDTSYFMRPFEHYVPFANLSELTLRLGQLIDDPPLRARITRVGSAWARRQFGALHFWARLFWQLEQIPAHAPAPRRHRFHPSNVVIPSTSLAVYRAFQQVRIEAAQDG